MNDHPETAMTPATSPVSGTTRNSAAMPARTRGFTIIEVLIVVAIIGLLVAIAYPAYTEYAREARRSDAHLALLSGAQSMERCRATAFSYENCTIPADSAEKFYTLELSDQTATEWTLTATAAGLQEQDSDCQEITLDHLGAQGPVSGSDPSECWK